MRLNNLLLPMMVVGAGFLASESKAATTRTTRIGGFSGKPLHGTEQCFQETFGSVHYVQNACSGGQALYYETQNNGDDNGGLWASSGYVNIDFESGYLGGPPTCALWSMFSDGTEFNTSGDIPANWGSGRGYITLPQQNSPGYGFTFVRCVLFPTDTISEVTVSSITSY